MLFSGIQGVAGGITWHSLGAMITKSAKLLQLIKSGAETTIDGIVDVELDIVHRLLESQSKFVLVAHSFGTLVALKMAAQLERSGKIGHLILIDGSPTIIADMSRVFIRSAHCTDQIDDKIIEVIFNHLMDSIDKEREFLAKLKLATEENWSAKVQLIIDYCSDEIRSAYSTEYLTNIITAISNRIKLAINAENGADPFVGMVLKSPITLLRAMEAPVVDLTDDYGLQIYTEHKVNVLYIDGNHSSMLENGDLARAINRIADETLNV